MTEEQEQLITSAAIREYVRCDRKTKIPFGDLTAGFQALAAELSAAEAFNWRTLFGKGKGKVATKKLLLKAGKEHWFKKDEPDFTGIYVWYHDGLPFYVGISQKVLQRVGQHAKVTNHFTASMAYKIASGIHPSKEKGRAKYDKSRIATVQEWLKDQQVAMLPIDNHDQLALFEIYCSMEFGCRLNVFETH